MLPALDVLLTILHIGIILFNLLGWIWRKTRKTHLVVIALTAASWFLLGIWYGWGYCFLTDWHWDVKRALGEEQLPNSFITYLVNNVLGGSWDHGLVDAWTLCLFIGAVAATLVVNIRFRKPSPPSF